MNQNSVLITGGTGYLGSSLARSLLKEGISVNLLLRKKANLKLISDISASIELYEHAGTTESISEIISEIKPSIVFHLASLYQVDHRLEDTDKLIKSNLEFPTQVLEASVRNNVKYFINAGSVAQNFNNETYNPLCLSAAMKQAFEDIIYYYTKNFPISAITLKIYDTYGADDPRTKILRVLQDAIRTNKTLEMSSPEQELHLVHISDIVSAFKTAWSLLKDQTISGHKIYSLPSIKATKLSELIKIYESISNKTISVNWNSRSRKGLFQAALSTQETILPTWAPKISLQEGLSEFVNANS